MCGHGDVDDERVGFDESPQGRSGSSRYERPLAARKTCSESALLERRPITRRQVHAAVHGAEETDLRALLDLIVRQPTVERLAARDQMELTVCDRADPEVGVHGSFP
jgi:hypothetical protein